MTQVIRYCGRLLALLAVAVAGACAARGDAASLDVANAPVTPENVTRLHLDPLGSVTLGAVDTESVFRMADFVPRGNRYYVVDAMVHKVKVYDRTGRALLVFGQKGTGIEDFDDPYRLSFLHDTLVVADLGRAGSLLLFDEQGRFLGLAPNGVERMPVGAILTDSVVYIAASVSPERDGLGMVRVRSREGHSRGSGCRIDQRYLDSERHDGFLGHLTVGSISSRGDQAYCWQTISPVVRAIDAAGNDRVVSRLAPPFYRAPRDEKFSMNAKKTLDFAASYTAHSLFQSTANGFISVYSHFDKAKQRFAFDLFACDSAAARPVRCATATTSGRVVRIGAPDTAFVEEPVAPGAPARVGIYRLRWEGGE